MTWSLRSIARSCVPTAETITRVASGATSLFCLLPAYEATKATIKAASVAGIKCLAAPTIVWNIYNATHKWKTIIDSSQFEGSCGSTFVGTATMATLAISTTLLSLYLAKRCLTKQEEAPIEVHLSPRTLEAAENVPHYRNTLVRKPLPPLPTLSNEKPPLPPSSETIASCIIS